MEDQHSVESARKDLDVIFNKINNSLKEFQIGAPEKDIEKRTEVSFQLEDQVFYKIRYFIKYLTQNMLN